MTMQNVSVDISPKRQPDIIAALDKLGFKATATDPQFATALDITPVTAEATESVLREFLRGVLPADDPQLDAIFSD